MDAALKANGGKYLVGKDVTYVDIAISNTLSAFSARGSKDWEKQAPEFKKYTDAIMALPNIKKWIETRPKTDY